MLKVCCALFCVSRVLSCYFCTGIFVTVSLNSTLSVLNLFNLYVIGYVFHSSAYLTSNDITL